MRGWFLIRDGESGELLRGWRSDWPGTKHETGVHGRNAVQIVPPPIGSILRWDDYRRPVTGRPGHRHKCEAKVTGVLVEEGDASTIFVSEVTEL